MSRTYRKRRTGKFENLPLPIIKNVLLIIITAIATIWFFAHKNASEIYIDGNVVAIIRDAKINAEEFEKLVSAKIYNDVNASIQIESSITIVPIHAPKNETVTLDHALVEVCKIISYLKESTVVYINDVKTVVFNDEEAANRCLDEILKTYNAERFTDNVHLKPEFVDSDEIVSVEKGYSVLTHKNIIEKTYEVASGDNLSNIAYKFGMTLNELYELNPALSGTTMLKSGQEIVLNVYRPVLSTRDY